MGRTLQEQLQEENLRNAHEEEQALRRESEAKRKEQKRLRLKLKEEQETVRQKILESQAKRKIEEQEKRERLTREQEEIEEQKEIEQQEKLRDIFSPFTKNINTYYIPTEKIYRLAYDEAFSWLKKESPNSTKILSKKNRAKLEGKSFLIYVKEKFTYILAKVTNAESVKRFRIEASTITQVRTEKGLLYFLVDKGDLAQQRNYLPITAIVAHVFDRYSERCFDKDLSRMEAIKLYCSEQLSGWVLKTDTKYMKPTKKGVSLGEYAYMQDDCGEFNLFLFLEKTFIASDMMSKQQGDTISESLIEFHKSRSKRHNGDDDNKESFIGIEHKKGEPIYLP